MIKANHQTLWVKFSWFYSRMLLKIYFRSIRYIGDYEPADLPILIIGNHFSWWDGFIQILLNKKYFRKRFHFMMLENELRKSMILNKIGAFSIVKGNRDFLVSLNYFAELLCEPQNLVLLFPQGKIQSLYTNRFLFEQGLDYILKRMKTDFQLVFNVNLFDYSSYRRPEISIYFKTYSKTKDVRADDIERDFNIYANECLEKQREG